MGWVSWVGFESKLFKFAVLLNSVRNLKELKYFDYSIGVWVTSAVRRKNDLIFINILGNFTFTLNQSHIN